MPCGVFLRSRQALNQSATYEVICRGIGEKGEAASDAMSALLGRYYIQEGHCLQLETVRITQS